MAAGTQSRRDADSGPTPDEGPEISVCESCPGTTVFLESGNTDGWISTDTTAAVTR
ncbi:hypothetical protein [Halorussus marinus]|uniref:hypothetical protein n=1 Tax=Halorussus marinus TaxID=2505976 RepID=UPI00142F5E4B|nr:hypothetical protein [Halorussus marinus]